MDSTIIAAIISSGTGICVVILSHYLRTLLEKRSKKNINFIKSFLLVIPDDIKMTDKYVDILTKNLDLICDSITMVGKKRDWKTLINTKKRLREYFEYSGRYVQGAHFGEQVLGVLNRSNKKKEIFWTMVKDVGYLYILAEDYEKGRKILNDACARIIKLTHIEISGFKRILFYAYRYMGISYMRDTIFQDLKKAREFFDMALDITEKFNNKESKSYKELYGKITANFGNLDIAEHNYINAYNNYQKSCEIFREIDDKEHIGISFLQIAQALITGGFDIEAQAEDILNYLEKANMHFLQLGWIEGEARVAEQYSKFYKYIADNTHGTDKSNNLQQAVTYAKHSESLFLQLKLPKAIGRIETIRTLLEEEIGRIA